MVLGVVVNAADIRLLKSRTREMDFATVISVSQLHHANASVIGTGHGLGDTATTATMHLSGSVAVQSRTTAAVAPSAFLKRQVAANMKSIFRETISENALCSRLPGKKDLTWRRSASSGRPDTAERRRRWDHMVSQHNGAIIVDDSTGDPAGFPSSRNS